MQRHYISQPSSIVSASKLSLPLMNQQDARSHWQVFSVEAIPTKTNLAPLDIALADVMATFGDAGPPSILDAGCGVGVVSRFVYSKGFSVIGVDINQPAVEHARHSSAALIRASDAPSCNKLEFFCDDILSSACPSIVAGAFDGVICQLVISIVGPGHDRAALLANLYTALRPGGYLYLSASGVSDDVNPTYAELYRSDLGITKEMHTYVSRDDQGRGLYVTHHFSAEELSQLMLNAGFTDIRIDKRRETSSRRKTQSAYFFYCYGRKPVGTTP
jgi:SAM-dependent methyltransferase